MAPPQPPPPFSASDSEVRTECLIGTYALNEKSGARALKAPPPHDWRVIENLPEAIPADRGAVRVDIRAKGKRKSLTLTKVTFHVARYVRLPGEIFYRPCERSAKGPALEANLYLQPVPIVRSNADAKGRVGSLLQLSKGPPIRFPWTVSLAKPFHLFLVVDGEHCYCIWSAAVSWVMGPRSGVIQVDNGGKKYAVLDSVGSIWRVPRKDNSWGTISRPFG